MRTDYSKKYYKKDEPKVEEKIEVTVSYPEATYVDGQEVVEDETESVVTTVEDVPEERELLGTVIAEALYVREAPSSDAEPVTTVKKGDELIVTVPSKGTPEWYKVCTAAGVEGYSMGKFIDIV